MDGKELLEACQKILGNIDCLKHGNSDYGGRDYQKMADSWKEISGFCEFRKSIHEEDEEGFNKLMTLVENHDVLGFAFGYVVGQEVDLLDPELAGAIETVKRAIREKSLLPYFPKQKKAV